MRLILYYSILDFFSKIVFIIPIDMPKDEPRSFSLSQVVIYKAFSLDAAHSRINGELLNVC